MRDYELIFIVHDGWHIPSANFEKAITLAWKRNCSPIASAKSNVTSD